MFAKGIQLSKPLCKRKLAFLGEICVPPNKYKFYAPNPAMPHSQITLYLKAQLGREMLWNITGFKDFVEQEIALMHN